MALFRKVLSSIGVGKATVDTVLDDSSYHAGGTMRAQVVLKGGASDQFIEGIQIGVVTSFMHDEYHREEFELVCYDIGHGWTIRAGETERVDVDLELPLDTPCTLGVIPVWVETRVALEKGRNASDRDPIEVQPGELGALLFEALESLGFRLVKADLEHKPHFFEVRLPMIQGLEFEVEYGDFKGRVAELEVIYVEYEDGMDLWLEIDRHTRGMKGMLSAVLEQNESFEYMDLSIDDCHQLREILDNTIRNML